MCKKIYSISLTGEEFIMLYTILLQINHELGKTVSANCLFVFDRSKGENELFEELLEKFINFREKRLMPSRDGGQI